jgi:hypothetical protein
MNKLFYVFMCLFVILPKLNFVFIYFVYFCLRFSLSVSLFLFICIYQAACLFICLLSMSLFQFVHVSAYLCLCFNLSMSMCVCFSVEKLILIWLQKPFPLGLATNWGELGNVDSKVRRSSSLMAFKLFRNVINILNIKSNILTTIL